jgi:hypothetical protein
LRIGAPYRRDVPVRRQLGARSYAAHATEIGSPRRLSVCWPVRRPPAAGYRLPTRCSQQAVPDQVRAACAWVSDHSGYFTIAAGLTERFRESPWSPRELAELRAGAVHAVELLSHALDRRLYSAQIDELLWNRGGAPRYKVMERPRSRNTAY